MYIKILIIICVTLSSCNIQSQKSQKILQSSVITPNRGLEKILTYEEIARYAIYNKEKAILIKNIGKPDKILFSDDVRNVFQYKYTNNGDIRNCVIVLENDFISAVFFNAEINVKGGGKNKNSTQASQ